MKILGITGNRSDYDLLSYLYMRLNNDDYFELKLFVSGAHLLSSHGHSIDNIEADGFNIIGKCYNLENINENNSRSNATGKLIIDLTNSLKVFQPDLIIAAGDREEVIAAGVVSAYSKIPFAHFFGGDFVSDGHPDNLVRNAASKLASIHFVSLQEHKQRLISMGEEENRIVVTGNPGIDKFFEEPQIDKIEIGNRIGVKVPEKYALLIYHPPVNMENDKEEIYNILKVLCKYNIETFISCPNTDRNFEMVFAAFDEYAQVPHFHFYKNLERNTFVNLYRNAWFQIGNSSSGICEGCCIGLPVINVGTRQTDRKAGENVTFVSGEYKEIEGAVKSMISMDGLKIKSDLYGKGNSAELAYKELKSLAVEKLYFKTKDPLRRGNI